MYQTLTVDDNRSVQPSTLTTVDSVNEVVQKTEGFKVILIIRITHSIQPFSIPRSDTMDALFPPSPRPSQTNNTPALVGTSSSPSIQSKTVNNLSILVESLFAYVQSYHRKSHNSTKSVTSYSCNTTSRKSNSQCCSNWIARSHTFQNGTSK